MCIRDRLTFRAVDDEGVDGRKILGRELDRRGETRAAQAHQAARLHRRNAVSYTHLDVYKRQDLV